ncbi:MAG TPA: formylmethanofuran dehydrogenase subunit C, partial [Methylocella sp.]|nr:formylmethanofuran dehydrogenase subunit C [Methylocella sp.]
MKPLVLTLKQEPGQRLDLAPLVPHLLEGKSAKDIAEIELQTTREKVTAGDIFKIRSGGTEAIHFEGGSVRFDNVGRGLKSGEIFIEGDCGKCVGREMSGGNLVVNGDSGPFAGSAMCGGRLEIAGDTGNFL